MVFATEQEKQELTEQMSLYQKLLMEHNKSLSEADALLQARRAVCNLNISFVLADVLNSFLSDAESTLKSMGLRLSGEDKHRFLLMQKSVKTARVMAGAFARPLYQMKDTGDACNCSDWYYHFLRLVETRVTDGRKTHMLLEFLLTMPSDDDVYDVSWDDFDAQNE